MGRKNSKALNLRKSSILINDSNNVFRLIHAEGDYMPGFICDIYNQVAVFQFHSIGMWKLKELFSKIIQKLLPKIEIIYDKSEKTLPKKHIDQYSVENSYLLKNLILKNTNVFRKWKCSLKLIGKMDKKLVFLLTKEKTEKFLGEMSK